MRKKDEEKVQRIKEAVASLMMEEGWSGTSISKIARKAEVSPATVYTYFDSKEDMLQCIYMEYSEHVFSYLTRQVEPEMDGAQIIETLMRSCTGAWQKMRTCSALWSSSATVRRFPANAPAGRGSRTWPVC